MRQQLWVPRYTHNHKAYVTDASLEMPIFFVNTDGSPGVSLFDAAAGRCPPLRAIAGMACVAARGKMNLRVNVRFHSL